MPPDDTKTSAELLEEALGDLEETPTTAPPASPPAPSAPSAVPSAAASPAASPSTPAASPAAPPPTSSEPRRRDVLAIPRTQLDERIKRSADAARRKIFEAAGVTSEEELRELAAAARTAKAEREARERASMTREEQLEAELEEARARAEQAESEAQQEQARRRHIETEQRITAAATRHVKPKLVTMAVAALAQHLVSIPQERRRRFTDRDADAYFRKLVEEHPEFKPERGRPAALGEGRAPAPPARREVPRRAGTNGAPPAGAPPPAAAPTADLTASSPAEFKREMDALGIKGLSFLA